MANALYPKWKESLINGDSNAQLNGNIKAVLVDTAAYTYSTTHQYLSDIPSGDRIATSGNLASKTYTAGVFDAADITFTAVSGDPSEALVIIVDTGSAATSRLVAYYDTGVTGLPVTPNGGDISVAWNASGLLAL